MSDLPRTSNGTRRRGQRTSAAFQTETWAAGATIFGPSEGDGSVYLVRSGCVRLFKRFTDGREISVGLLGPNTVFTQEETGVDSSSGISAVAMVDSTVSRVPFDELAGAIADAPELAASMISGMNRRLTEVQALVEALATASMPDRIAFMLLQLANRFGKPGVDGMVVIEQPLGHRALANMIGAHRVTVTRQLQKLEEAGMVRSDARNQLSVDVDRLRSHLWTRRKTTD